MQKPGSSPEHEAAVLAENALMLQAQNEYLKQRVVALSTRVRELTAKPAEGRHKADS